MPNVKSTRNVKLWEDEIKQHASGMTNRELNKLIDELLDKGKFEEASIYAKVYVRRN